jgi:hypothetical protein
VSSLLENDGDPTSQRPERSASAFRDEAGVSCLNATMMAAA